MIDTRARQAAVDGRRFRQLRTLTEVSRALTSVLSTDEVYRIVMPHAAELLGAQRAVLLFPDEQGQYLLRASHGVEPALATSAEQPGEESVAALLSRVLVAPQDEILAVPLVTRDRVSGVLAVHLSRALADEDGWALAALADQAAVALDQVGMATPRQNEELLGLLVDVREQAARAEAEAEAQRDRYRLVGRATRDAIRDWNVETGAVEWSEALQSVHGHPLAGVPPTLEWWTAHIHADDRERVSGHLKAVLAGAGESWSDEYNFLRSDGSAVRVHDRGYILRDPAGRPTRMISSMLDLSERVRMESALLDREERLRLAAAAADVITWRIDLRAPGEPEALDASQETPTMTEFLAQVHPDDRAQVQARLAGCLHHCGPYDSVHRVLRADGSVRWIRDRGKVFCDAAKEPLYVTGAAADITELKEIDDQRQRLVTVAEQARMQSERERQRAETANRMKDEFLATVSHELRTPLTAILGWSRILRDTQFDRARVEKGIEIIERNARAQVRIVEDILDVSRIITGKVQLDLRRLNVAGMLEAAVNTVGSAASARGVAIQVTSLGPLGELLGDSERLQQVLWNLLSNAIKFTPAGGKVELGATRSAGQIVLSVRDTGKGITPAFLPHVFERFLQGDASTTRSYGGLGLGLAIVRHIVELHGGTVEAASPGEGQGATFTVSLPVGATTASTTSEPTWTVVDPLDPGALDGAELLVVDDEQDTRELVATILESAGARVRLAASAAEAMEALREQVPDAIVSDIGMPGEDGYSLIQRIRDSADEKTRFVPALALTAYARGEDRRRARAAGFQMFLSKPIHPEELVKVIGELLMLDR